MTAAPTAPGTTAPSALAERPADVVRRVPLPLAARRLTVQRVEELSPTMRRVALGGPDLDGFEAHGPADHVKVFFPEEPGSELTMPVLTEGRWVNRDDATLVYRDYTVRTVAAGSDELLIDMVVHEHGPAGRWAAQAEPGQVLGTLGPRGSAIMPLDRDTYLLAADETGVPALLNWFDRLPEEAYVRAFVEVGEPGHEVDLPGGVRAEVTWLYRNGTPAGGTTLLQDAVGAALVQPPTGSLWAWAAGEASAVRAIRAHLAAAGMGRDSYAMTGYWRRGVANFDHHSPDA
ncbi:siderophore-interacting protein [Actinotalea ferrariae]|uniref:siderophore-interacting protein n=1 Tax=Actinotalea ferrariae TaxID=1386098 RepID=UPI001C8B8E3E|nr:siderophore-interacting protein [Actinotalea ferrariae]MBX9244034.1 siderophore-interacting protein [Actinotalea ferrariae]